MRHPELSRFWRHMAVISDARGREAFAFVYCVCVCVCLRRGEITLSAWPSAAQSGGMMGVERPQNCCGYAHYARGQPPSSLPTQSIVSLIQ